MTPSRKDLLKFITDRYDLEELKTLCFELYVPFDDLPGATRPAKARELIDYVERHEKTQALLALLAEAYPAQFRKRFGDIVDAPPAGAPMSEWQADHIQVLAWSIGLELGRDSQKNLYQPVYALLHSHFDVSSFRNIPAERYPEARRLLVNWLKQLSEPDPADA